VSFCGNAKRTEKELTFSESHRDEISPKTLSNGEKVKRGNPTRSNPKTAQELAQFNKRMVGA